MKFSSLFSLALLSVATKMGFAMNPVEDSFYQVAVECDNIVNNTCFAPGDVRGKIITDFLEVTVIQIARGTFNPSNINTARRLEAANGLRGSRDLSAGSNTEVIGIDAFLNQDFSKHVALSEQGHRHLFWCSTKCNDPVMCSFGCRGRRRMNTNPVGMSTTYDQNPGQMCRVADGGPGKAGTEFIYKGLDHTREWCEDQCDQHSMCVAFEHITADGKCNLWTQTPDSFQAHAPATCNLKKKAIYSYHDGNYCRTESMDTGSDGVEYTAHHGVATKDACEDMCTFDANCLGYEYDSNLKCEIWNQAPAKFHQTSSGNSCAVKIVGVQKETHMLADLIEAYPLTVDETDCLTTVQCKVSWFN